MTSEPNIIDSLEKYQKALSGNQAFGYRTVYRGQNCDKPLVPKLYRIEWIPEAAGNLPMLEEELLSDFENQAKPYLQSPPLSKLEWIALAQHHGLPTRLLDWTQSPLVALFFAVDFFRDSAPYRDAHLDEDGVVWILHASTVPRLPYENLRQIDNIQPDALIYFPAHINPRINAQQSCFTTHQQPGEYGSVPIEWEELVGPFSRLMRKLVIPANKKKLLRNELDKLGVNHFTIFPDLVGLCKKLEWKIYNHQGSKINSYSSSNPQDAIHIPDTYWNPHSRKEEGESD